MKTIGIGGGISAMPSMHVALATLFAAAAFRLGKAVGWITAIYAFLVFFGSVDLGWHYAIDGIAGAGAAVAIWVGAGALTRQLLKTPQPIALVAEATL